MKNRSIVFSIIFVSSYSAGMNRSLWFVPTQNLEGVAKGLFSQGTSIKYLAHTIVKQAQQGPNNLLKDIYQIPDSHWHEKVVMPLQTLKEHKDAAPYIASDTAAYDAGLVHLAKQNYARPEALHIVTRNSIANVMPLVINSRSGFFESPTTLKILSSHARDPMVLVQFLCEIALLNHYYHEEKGLIVRTIMNRLPAKSSGESLMPLKDLSTQAFEDGLVLAASENIFNAHTIQEGLAAGQAAHKKGIVTTDLDLELTSKVVGSIKHLLMLENHYSR